MGSPPESFALHPTASHPRGRASDRTCARVRPTSESRRGPRARWRNTARNQAVPRDISSRNPQVRAYPGCPDEDGQTTIRPGRRRGTPSGGGVGSGLDDACMSSPTRAAPSRRGCVGKTSVIRLRPRCGAAADRREAAVSARCATTESVAIRDEAGHGRAPIASRGRRSALRSTDPYAASTSPARRRRARLAQYGGPRGGAREGGATGSPMAPR